MKSFLLVGQSNMAGRGDFGEVPKIENSRCFMLRNGKWQPMSEPINVDRSIFDATHSGIGLAASFADEYAKHFNEDIGLIPCAEGASLIEEWQPDEVLYDNAVFNCRLATRSSEIVGILWHQGEQNAAKESDTVDYEKKLINTLLSLRKDITNDLIPIILGTLGDFVLTNTDTPFADLINSKIIKSIEYIPFSGLVYSSGLTCRSDNIHFNSASYRELGKRYFEQYLKLIELRV